MQSLVHFPKKCDHSTALEEKDYKMAKIAIVYLVLASLLVGTAYARWGLPRPSQASCGDMGPDPDVYPWNAVLEHDSPDRKYRSLSKGFLISDRHVLTSVSSIHNAQENWQLSGVRLGVGVPQFGTKDMKGESYSIKSIEVHETLDLAIIKLDTPVNFTDTVKPICLPESERFDIAGADRTVTSHCKRFFESETGEPGSLHEKTTVTSPNATVLNFDFCQELYKRAGAAMTEDQLCSWDQRGDTCSGDLGGALMVQKRDKYFVVGIGSYLPSTSNIQINVFPGIYTNVIRNLPWIVKNLKEIESAESSAE